MQGVGRKNTFARHRRTIAVAVLGIVVGAVVGFVGAGLIITAEWNSMQTKVNGWNNTLMCGQVGNNILVQAACAEHLPLVNLPQEAVYWTTTVDGAGHTLTGKNDYVLQFPNGGLPPNKAFWSVTMYNARPLTFVNNSIGRYEVSGTSGLVSNANGSVDIYIQNAPPTGHESNWLPAPAGDFSLFLRVYLPGPEILNGSYRVPPVAEVS